MTDGRESPSRIESLFEQAAALPPEKRRTFLDQACAGSPALRDELESLLRADEQAGDFLTTLQHEDEPEPGAPVPLQPGRIIGAYQLLAKIGEGGMGTVYLAARADDQFRKRVAIKLVPLATASDDYLRRFRTERHILASLDHPSIARLLDAGTTEEGLPYVVMEYVEGEPIDEYCDRHGLTIRERVELFRAVCAAVHYAHQNLVVHRDLKPSNILVTEEGVPKLLDFGIAKLLNPELTSPSYQPTVTWHRVLTPDYASPEQVRGRPVTTASDVYSLGVVLYELLTGQLPFRLSDKSPVEIERVLTGPGPERPSATVARVDGPGAEAVSRARGTRPGELRRRLAGDLDDIVLTALRAEPRRRYASADRLSEDLRRHLAGLTVSARRGPFTYRLGKFLRRNRLAVGVASLFVLLVTLFAVVTAIQARRIAAERDQARVEAEKSRQALSFMQRVFEVADPTESRGEEVTLREVLDRGAERVLQDLEDQPEARASLAKTLGQIYYNLGLYERARTQMETALEIRRRLFGDADATVVESLANLGAVHHDMGDYERAEELYREGLELAAELPAGAADAARLLLTNRLAVVLYDRGDYDAAESLARQAFAVAGERLDDDDPEVTTAIVTLAAQLLEKGEIQEALELQRLSLERDRRRLGDLHPETVRTLANLGVMVFQSGDVDEARRIYEETLALQRQVYDDEHPDLARTLSNLAVVLREQGDYPAAEELFREALDMRTRLLGPEHPDVGFTRLGLADLLIRGGKPAAAEPLARETVEIWRQALAAESWLIGAAESLLGASLARQERYDEAEPLLTGGYARIREQLGTEAPRTREALARLVELYEAWGRPDDAERFRALLDAPEPPAS